MERMTGASVLLGGGGWPDLQVAVWPGTSTCGWCGRRGAQGLECVGEERAGFQARNRVQSVSTGNDWF